MKRLSPMSASTEARDVKKKFSQSEVQTLIQQEVRSAMKNKEAELQGFIETVQQLDNGVSIKASIQMLQARINRVSKRADAALACMMKTQEKIPLPPSVNTGNLKVDPHPDETMETTSLTDKTNVGSTAKDGSLFELMDKTKKALKKMGADNEALTAAIADLSEEQLPVVTPGHSKELVRLVKREPGVNQKKENNHKEPNAKNMKQENSNSGDSSDPRHTDRKTEQDKNSYPPLPPTTLPSALDTKASLYSIPQRLDVQMALVRKPRGLSVLWKVADKAPSAPPMESYTILMTVEKGKGSGVFPDWKILDEVKALDLPMCVVITKYKPGYKVCAAVVGKDRFGRYGPYSRVVTATIPEEFGRGRKEETI